METWDNETGTKKEPFNMKNYSVVSQTTSPAGEPFEKPPVRLVAYADRLAHRPCLQASIMWIYQSINHLSSSNP